MKRGSPSWPARFWSGLINPSPLAGVFTVAAFLGAIASLLGTFTPAWMAKNAVPLLLDTNRDHGIVVTAQLLKWRVADEKKTRLIVTGSSPTRHSLHPRTIADELASYGFEFDETANITVARATGPHLLALIDNMPEGDGLFIVGINPTRLVRDPGEDYERADAAPPLGVRSEGWDELGEELGFSIPLRLGIFLWDNRSFYLPRAMKAFTRWREDKKPPRYRERPYIGRRRQNFGVFGMFRKQFKKIAALDESERERRLQVRLDIYREVVERGRKLGLQVVFYQAPVNPLFDKRVHVWAQTRKYWNRVLDLADELDVPVVVPPELTAKEFWDQAHLRSRKAMIRVSRDVAAQIGEALG